MGRKKSVQRHIIYLLTIDSQMNKQQILPKSGKLRIGRKEASVLSKDIKPDRELSSQKILAESITMN